jgi:peptidylprolyl isomerase
MRAFPHLSTARADEPGSGRVSGARTIESPRWPLAPLASAALALALATTMTTAVAVVAPTTALAQVGKTMTTPSGLQITDSKIGTGATPRPGQICVMHYTGWLYQDGAKGKKFDSSVDRGTPFEFPIGKRQVIGGWEEGVATMKVGGKRTLIIPPSLGYGARGAGGVIPPNATLIFEVELLDVKG